MLLFILGNLWAAPQNEVLISNESQEAAVSTSLGVEELSTLRVSFSYGLSDVLSVVSSYGYSHVITDYASSSHNSYGYEEDMYYHSNGFSSDFVQHQLHVGPRYMWQAKDWLGVYGKAEGVVSYSSFYAVPSLEAKDPDPEVKNNSFSFGGTLSGGLMGTLSLGEDIPSLLLYVEGGYRLQTASTYGSLGDLNLSGGYTSMGIGTRF